MESTTNAQIESYTRLHGRWLLTARLAWAAGFSVLTVMYALGFLAARDALSTVCKEELCPLRQGWSGPPIGYADPLRPDHVKALDALGLTLDQYGWLAASQIGPPVLEQYAPVLILQMEETCQ